MKTFTLHEVGSGVWAAIAEPGGVAVGNAGYVDLGDETALVFDTTISLTAAGELRLAAERSGEITTVAYSHWHGDHVYGAGAMPADALIVATAATATLMEERGAERLRALKADPPTEGPFAELAATEVPKLELIYPDETYADERSFTGTERTAHAISYGGGHTLTDAFLWLPEEKILFAGDLVVYGTHPWVGDGDVGAWPGILERMGKLGPETIVPGHGPVAGPDAIDFMLGYLHDLSRAESGSEMPDRYASLANPNGWARNVESLAAQRV
jgi:glyoxylase-like metal-dependent hydrolase (beta-lactamase superfamily II)